MKTPLQIGMLALAVAGGIWVLRSATTPRAGSGEQPAEVPLQHLPPGAERIDYWIQPPTTSYSFDIDEQGFESWVAVFEREGMERHEGPTAVNIVSPLTSVTDMILIEDAIQFRWRKDDASLQLTYDRQAERAHYYGHYR